jgi:hypothetical protein
MKTDILGQAADLLVIDKPKRTLWILVWILALSVFITSCAISYRYALRSKITYKDIFAACLEAINSMRFQMTSSDAVKGEIRAEKYTLVGGNYNGWPISYTTETIQLQGVREPRGTKIHMRVWPGAIGAEARAKSMFDTFSSVLASRVPDAEVLPKY